MNVTLSFATDLEDIPSTVASLLRNKLNKLQNRVEHACHNVERGHDIAEGLKQFKKLKSSIQEIFNSVEEFEQIYRGYVGVKVNGRPETTQTQPPEASSELNDSLDQLSTAVSELENLNDLHQG